MLNNEECSRSDAAAAYLDGELDVAAVEEFERHVASCRACASAVADQRRLLCVLDGAFSDQSQREFALPKNFIQVVTAHAQTDMCSLRRPSEKRRALLLSTLLAAIAFALLGAANFGAAFAPARGVWKAITTALDMAAHTIFETLMGLTLFARALGGRFSAEPGAPQLLIWLLLASALFLLLRLILNYHHQRASE
ncbi:MAG: zf-HC2 domain-containing protein [Acidobacteriota bacterium]|nr:zf-HC2 domain-containing protein [Acidobacteriota bacterium]